MGELDVAASGQAHAAKELPTRDRINTISKAIVASQEFKDFEAALKQHGIDHIEFGDPPKKFNVPFSARDKEGVARALAAILDKQVWIPDLEHPDAPHKHDTESAKSLALDFLRGQTDALQSQKNYPDEADVTLTVAKPNYETQTIDASQP